MKNKDQISLLRSALLGARSFVLAAQKIEPGLLSSMAECAIADIDLALDETDRAPKYEELHSIIRDAQRDTELECTCGGNPAEDPNCCPACKVYHLLGKISAEIAIKEPAPTFRRVTEDDLTIATFHPSQYISIACGNSCIKIDCRTGAVKLPKDVPLDEAAVKFWHAVAEVFPEARRQIIESR